jgi:hypothetical protein
MALLGPGQARSHPGTGAADWLLSRSALRPMSGSLVFTPSGDMIRKEGEDSGAGWLGVAVYRHQWSGTLQGTLWLPVLWSVDDLGQVVMRANGARFPWWDRGAFAPVPEDIAREERRLAISFPLRLGEWAAQQGRMQRFIETWSSDFAAEDGPVLDASRVVHDWDWTPEGEHPLWELDSEVLIFRRRAADRGAAEVLDREDFLISDSPLAFWLGEGSGSRSGRGNENGGDREREPAAPRQWTPALSAILDADQRAWIARAVGEGDPLLSLSGPSGSGKSEALLAAILERWVRRLLRGDSAEPVFWLVEDPEGAHRLLTALNDVLPVAHRWWPRWDVFGAPPMAVAWTRIVRRAQYITERDGPGLAVLWPESLSKGEVLGSPRPLASPRDRAAYTHARSEEKIRRILRQQAEADAARSRNAAEPDSDVDWPQDLLVDPDEGFARVEEHGAVVPLGALSRQRDWDRLVRMRGEVAVWPYVHGDLWLWALDARALREADGILRQTLRIFWSALRDGLGADWVPEGVTRVGDAALSEQIAGLRGVLLRLGQDIAEVESWTDLDPASALGQEQGISLNELPDLQARVERLRYLEERGAELESMTAALRDRSQTFLGPDLPFGGPEVASTALVRRFLERLDESDRFVGAFEEGAEPLAELERRLDHVGQWDKLLASWQGAGRMQLQFALSGLHRRFREEREALELEVADIRERIRRTHLLVEHPTAKRFAALLERWRGWKLVWESLHLPWPDWDSPESGLPEDSPFRVATKELRERWLDTGFRTVALHLGVWLGELVFLSAALSGGVDRSVYGALLPITVVSGDEALSGLTQWSEGGKAELLVVDGAQRWSADRYLPVLALTRRAWLVGDDARLSSWPLSDTLPQAVSEALRLRYGFGRTEDRHSLLSGALWEADGDLRTLVTRYRGGPDLQSLVSAWEEVPGEIVVGREKAPLSRLTDPSGTTLPVVFHEGLVGHSERLGGDIWNGPEAEAVAAWLLERRETLSGDPWWFLPSLVLVVTPFAAQEAVLRRVFSGYAELAEVPVYRVVPEGVTRPLVLVSPVLGAGEVSLAQPTEGSWKTFWHMAASRARMNLGVFGDADWLRSGRGGSAFAPLVSLLKDLGTWRRTVVLSQDSGDGGSVQAFR